MFTRFVIDNDYICINLQKMKNTVVFGMIINRNRMIPNTTIQI